MWPLIAVAAATSLAQLYMDEKARGAKQDALNKIEAEFNKLIPPGYDVSITDPPEYIKEKIPLPEFDNIPQKLEAFKVAGKYVPEAAPYIAEQAPQLVQETGEGREGREAQLSALRRLKGIGEAETDPAFQAQMAEALRQSQQAAQQQQQSVLSQAQRQGRLGGTGTLAAQLIGSQGAMQNAAISGQRAAADAYRNRLDALRQSASLGGDIRAADISMEKGNVDIINAFNQRTSKRMQDYYDARAQMANEGNLFNLQNQQATENANIKMRNKQMQEERDRRDALAKWGYGAKERERDYQSENIWKAGDWKERQRQYQNQMKAQQYQDQLGKYGMKAGILGQQGDINASRWDAYGNAIKNFGGGVMTGMRGEALAAKGETAKPSGPVRDDGFYDYIPDNRPYGPPEDDPVLAPRRRYRG